MASAHCEEELGQLLNDVGVPPEAQRMLANMGFTSGEVLIHANNFEEEVATPCSLEVPAEQRPACKAKMCLVLARLRQKHSATPDVESKRTRKTPPSSTYGPPSASEPSSARTSGDDDVVGTFQDINTIGGGFLNTPEKKGKLAANDGVLD